MSRFALMPVLATVLTVVFCLVSPRTMHAADPWLVELRSFDAVHSRQAVVGKTLGNAMLPMLLVSFFQQRMVGMFGKMRAAEPIRWVGYPDGKAFRRRKSQDTTYEAFHSRCFCAVVGRTFQ